MTTHPAGKRTLRQAAGGWLHGIVFTPGWPRRVLLIVVAALFLLAALALTGGADYREDPSALVPRSAQSYVEAKNLDQLLRTVGTWRLWADERRSSGQERYNQIQVDVGGLLSEHVTGPGTRPLRWLAAAERAAYCVNKDESGVESWALLLQVGDPAPFLSELLVDQSLQLETVDGTQESGIVKVTGQRGDSLYLGILAPWLIVSSADTLPAFAFTSVKRPAFSLAHSDLLPDWTRGAALRGVYNPAYRADAASLSAYSIVTGWMAPEMRINFLSSFRNGVETITNAAILTDKVKGGGVWPLFWLLLLLAAIVCLLLALALVLVMIGWGGWLKVLALRAGIAPASAPAAVDPSPAFKEDTGDVDAEAKASPPAAAEEPSGEGESTNSSM